MNKNVSIIIPTFNRADFLVECIDSCLAQTQPCEIIVCDHGSTDSTPEVVKKYGDQIKYIRRELDSGVHFCWLDGILHANNDLIHINYDDDWIYPTYIEECMQLFTENVGCVFTDAIAYHDDEKKFGRTLFNLTNQTGVYTTKSLFNFNIKEVQEVIQNITSIVVPKNYFTNGLIINSVALVALGIYYSNKLVEFKNRWMLETFYLLVFTVIFRVSSLIWGFAIYFIIWHSIPSIINQINYLNGEVSWNNFRKYIRSAFLYWVISLIGIATLYLLFKDIVTKHNLTICKILQPSKMPLT